MPTPTIEEISDIAWRENKRSENGGLSIISDLRIGDAILLMCDETFFENPDSYAGWVTGLSPRVINLSPSNPYNKHHGYDALTNFDGTKLQEIPIMPEHIKKYCILVRSKVN